MGQKKIHLRKGEIKDNVALSYADDKMKVVGDVKGKVALLMEDMIDTAVIEVAMADALIESGAKAVWTSS